MAASAPLPFQIPVPSADVAAAKPKIAKPKVDYASLDLFNVDKDGNFFCLNCGSNSQQMRKGPHGIRVCEKKRRSLLLTFVFCFQSLCNRCGLYYLHHKRMRQCSPEEAETLAEQIEDARRRTGKEPPAIHGSVEYSTADDTPELETGRGPGRPPKRQTVASLPGAKRVNTGRGVVAAGKSKEKDEAGGAMDEGGEAAKGAEGDEEEEEAGSSAGSADSDEASGGSESEDSAANDNDEEEEDEEDVESSSGGESSPALDDDSDEESDEESEQSD